MADMPPDVDANLGDPAMAGAGEEMHKDEPYGSQVLRRVHEDHGILMKDYDQMMNLLDHEPTKALLTKHMGVMDKFMSDVEGTHAKHYKDLPQIAAADRDEEETGAEPAEEFEEENKDMSTPDEEPAEQSPVPGDEEPGPEEAYEGSTKSLRKKYRHKDLDTSSVRPGDTVKLAQAYDRWDAGLGVTVVRVDSTGRNVTVRLPDGTQKPFHRSELTKALPKKGKACPPCAAAKNAEEMGADDGSLKDYEKKTVGEAAGFLKDLSRPESELDEEGRMKSYHYHKSLAGIGQVKDMAAGEAPQPMDEEPPIDPTMGGKRHPRHRTKGVPVWFSTDGMVWVQEDFPDAGAARAAMQDAVRTGEQATMTNPSKALKGARRKAADLPPDVGAGESQESAVGFEEQEGAKSLHPHRKAAAEASAFFKDLAGERAFGDTHRKMCEKHMKALDEAANGGGPQEPDGDEYPGVQMEDEAPHEPGEMGEKRLALIRANLEQQKKIAEMNAKLGGIVSRLA